MSSQTMPTPTCPVYPTGTDKAESILHTNSDYAGVGMLAAFFVTATISISATLFAYLSGTLEQSDQNFVDSRLLSHVQGFWYKIFPHRRTRKLSLASAADPQVTRNFRKEGETQFILALSDQQLVTGIAILLAALANLGYIKRYEIIMAHSLAWFSATTHLATLDILSNYLESHKIVRFVRTVAIVTFMALLTCTFVIRAITSMDGYKPEAEVSCVWNQPPQAAGSGNWSGIFNIAWQSSWILALLLVLFGYLIRIQALYIRQRDPLYVLGWLFWTFKKFGSKYRPYKQMYNENKATLRYQRILWVSGANGQKRWLPFGYDDSYLSSVPGILFSFSYGVSQVVSVRWGWTLTLISHDNPWGFGQVVALLLLCLPFMAAGATISDYKRRQRHQYVRDLRDLEHGLGSNTWPLIDRGQHWSKRNDFDAIESLFEQKRGVIDKYFHREVRLIDEAESKANRLPMVHLKQSLLNGYAVVEQREREMSIAPHLVWFCIQACGAIVMGALLNAASFDHASKDDQRGVWFSIATLLAFILSKTVTLTYEIVTILRMG